MTNYIKEIRKLIGNSPLMLVGTSVIAVRMARCYCNAEQISDCGATRWLHGTW